MHLSLYTYTPLHYCSLQDTNFTKGVEVIGNMENVVEALFGRAKGLAKTHAS